MKVLGIDLETTGLNCETDEIIEIGAVVYNWETHTTEMILSEVIHIDTPLRQEIIELTSITDAMVKDGEKLHRVLSRLNLMAIGCGALMAHNAPFDLSFLQKFSFYPGNVTVIDSRTDLPLDRKKHQSMKLGHLAYSHGFINPFPHRALFDVMTMLKIASHYDINEIIARSKSLTVTLIADVSFEDKELAKTAGFFWDPDHKRWKLSIKECDIDSMNFPFKTKKVITHE